MAPTPGRILEPQPEDPIRLNAQALCSSLRLNLHLPTKRKAAALRFLRRSRKDLFGSNEMHPAAPPAGGLEGHHDLRDGERMVEEDTGQVAVLRVPANDPAPRLTLCRKHCGAAVSQGIHKRLGTLGIPIELNDRTIEVAVVKEELQSSEDGLAAPTEESHDVA
jgi:hypothetical protein